MTHLERLLAEAVPTGTFGGARPAKPRRCEEREKPQPQWTAAQQAEHRAVLEAALEAVEGRGPAVQGRHLRAVDTDAA